MKEYKPLPIGIDDFQKIIQQGCYYVDKTLLIKTLLDTTAEVTLFTRPRRFGKSLNLSMLKYFFEKSESVNKSELFSGLNIASAGEKYQEHKEKYPVIMLNFKVAKQRTFGECYDLLIQNIIREFARHEDCVQTVELKKNEGEKYERLRNGIASKSEYMDAIRFLCECLEKAYGEKVILLIDEYDVPLENAHFRGFYTEMVDFIRGLLGEALKTNTSLKLAVITGCLRISKESIFTGLNNLAVVSIENKAYGEYFGFTEEEVQEMLEYYDSKEKMPKVRAWYNGYIFGKTQVYNPWSLVNHMNDVRVDSNAYPIAYWSNTSSNSIVKDLIYGADDVVKAELEILISGGSIEKPIHEDITYEDVYKSKDNLWNFLYFTGYLKKVNERYENRKKYATLTIPNEEVAYIYDEHITDWMNECVYPVDLTKLYEATLAGDVEVMEEEITSVLARSISYYDGTIPTQREAFYHGVMIGMYQSMNGYLPVSNRESGDGRPDFLLKYVNHRGKACIMEFKVAEKVVELERKAEEALAQIESKKYRAGLEDEGYVDILEYGISFYKKSCVVRKR